MSPKTGDAFPIMPIFFVMMMAGIGLVTVVDTKKRNNR
jgi:hypothetical protein